MSTINPDSAMLIGKNEHGYEFGVMLHSGAWWGCAIGTTGDKNQMVFFFPNCDSTDMYPAHSDAAKDEVIKRTIAYANYPEGGYGGISTYFVDESLRAVPRDFICLNCDEFLCDGECGISDTNDEIDCQIYEDTEENLGSCCECRKTENVRNIWLTDKKAPISGKGWGCLTCGLPADGAVAVLCDECHIKLSALKINPKFVCRGYAGENERIICAELTEDFNHNFEHEFVGIFGEEIEHE